MILHSKMAAAFVIRRISMLHFKIFRAQSQRSYFVFDLLKLTHIFKNLFQKSSNFFTSFAIVIYGKIIQVLVIKHFILMERPETHVGLLVFL